MCEEDLVEVQGEGSLVISESERAKRGQKNARGAPCNETFVLIIVTRLMSADKSPPCRLLFRSFLVLFPLCYESA